MNKGFLGLALAAFVSSAFAQTPSNATSQSKRSEMYYHFSIARLMDEQGQWQQAIDEYKKALELDPKNSSIYSEMAETYLRNGRAREAVDTALKAVSLNQDNIEAHKLLRSVYMSQITATGGQGATKQNIDLAIREFEEILRIDPSDRESYLMLGRLYQAENAPEKAEAVYRKYLGIEPGSEDGVLSLAKL